MAESAETMASFLSGHLVGFILGIASFLRVLDPTGKTSKACAKNTKLCSGLLNRT